MGIMALMAASIIGALLSGVFSYIGTATNAKTQELINERNIEAQTAINEQNINAQKEINQQNIDYSKEFAQNQIQWKMEDLEAAGLNPTMAAGMTGGTYSAPTLSAPTSKAAMSQAPMLDMNGVASAVNSMSNMMLTSYLLKNRNDIQSERNDIIRTNASNRDDVLRTLYRNKAKYFNSDNMKFVGNAKQAEKAIKDEISDEDWAKLLKELKNIK